MRERRWNNSKMTYEEREERRERRNKKFIGSYKISSIQEAILSYNEEECSSESFDSYISSLFPRLSTKQMARVDDIKNSMEERIEII